MTSINDDLSSGFEKTKLELISITKEYEITITEIRIIKEQKESSDITSYDLNNEICRLQRLLDNLKVNHDSLLETSLENQKDNESLNEMIITMKKELNR